MSQKQKITIAVPFNQLSLQGNELKYIAEAVEASHISGDGEFTRRCHRFLEERLGVTKALLTPSCTHALEMTALLLDIGPGDEVILPSFAFVSVANAYAIRGARPVFVDIRPDTLNVDERQLERLITERTKAIVLIHYAGVGCEMDAICEIAARHRIPVIEDNAHGLFGKYKGTPLGTFGTFSTLSFHETKNFTCGEGGALLINDSEYAQRAEIIREKGTNRTEFFRGRADKYTWVDIGSSYLPSDINAAYLFAQFEMESSIQGKHERIWSGYAEQLAPWADRHGVGVPHVPAHCDQTYHMFYLLMRDEAERNALIAHLDAHGISAVFHYLPLHRSQMGVRYGCAEGDCPVTETVSSRLVRLPLFADLAESDQAKVIAAVTEFGD